jgi:hypothetical protein
LFIFSMPNKLSIYRKLESIMFNFIGRPIYYTYVKNIVTLRDMTTKLRDCGFINLENAYYSVTPLLSKIFRNIGLSEYSDNLFVIVARRIE